MMMKESAVGGSYFKILIPFIKCVYGLFNESDNAQTHSFRPTKAGRQAGRQGAAVVIIIRPLLHADANGTISSKMHSRKKIKNRVGFDLLIYSFIQGAMSSSINRCD